MTTTRQINTVAVMGAGTMGAGIAALCASKGANVLLLDMPSKNGERNAVAAGAKARMTEGRAPVLDDPAQADLIEVGNFEDDLGRLAKCDLIVEAIIEDLGAKRALFEKLQAARRDGSIVTTNTSGIPLHEIIEGMPAQLRREVAVTHFFNPVKVMKLVELVPGEDTDDDVVATLQAFLGDGLDKGVVLAKDTVNFIANRIGCFWLLAGLIEGGKAGGALSIEAIDAGMSAPVGVPPTGLYGLVDLVGLDVLGLVSTNLRENLPANDTGRDYLDLPTGIAQMLERGQVGRKAGGGFYRMRKTDDGGRVKETFDVAAGDWRASDVATLDAEHQSLTGIIFADDALGRYMWTVMGGTLLYAAGLVPEICDSIVGIDRAMRWGFNWKQGPFEMLDTLGPARVIERLESEGRPRPAMLQVLRDAGAEHFYRDDGREYLGHDGDWHAVS